MIPSASEVTTNIQPVMTSAVVSSTTSAVHVQGVSVPPSSGVASVLRDSPDLDDRELAVPAVVADKEFEAGEPLGALLCPRPSARRLGRPVFRTAL
jgi:hypothetical protein